MRTMNPDSRRALRRARAGLAAVTGLLALGALAGCESLLEVESPTRVPATVLDDPALAATIVLGVQADFECAYSLYAGSTAIYIDELYASTEFTEDNQMDTRNIGPGNLNGNCAGRNGGYVPLSRARYTGDEAVRRLSAYTDAEVANRVSLMASAATYGAYALVFIGEGYCRAAINEGPELTPAMVLDSAEVRFTKAIEFATQSNNADMLRTALVGRARVRLNRGKLAEAAADARLVPAGFRKDATYSATSTRRENTINVAHFRSNFWSVDPRYRELTVDGVPDPRVQVTFSGRNGIDGRTPLWFAQKAALPSSPIRLASWEEAQLILAEADFANAVQYINNVRAKHNLPLYRPANPGDEAAVRAQIIEERRREFFLEGHRLGDVLRFGLPFDQGMNHKNSIRFNETLTCLPLPLAEIQGNPNIES